MSMIWLRKKEEFHGSAIPYFFLSQIMVCSTGSPSVYDTVTSVFHLRSLGTFWTKF